MLFFYMRHGCPIYHPDGLIALGKRQARHLAAALRAGRQGDCHPRLGECVVLRQRGRETAVVFHAGEIPPALPFLGKAGLFPAGNAHDVL